MRHVFCGYCVDDGHEGTVKAVSIGWLFRCIHHVCNLLARYRSTAGGRAFGAGGVECDVKCVCMPDGLLAGQSACKASVLAA